MPDHKPVLSQARMHLTCGWQQGNFYGEQLLLSRERPNSNFSIEVSSDNARIAWIDAPLAPYVPLASKLSQLLTRHAFDLQSASGAVSSKESEQLEWENYKDKLVDSIRAAHSQTVGGLFNGFREKAPSRGF